MSPSQLLKTRKNDIGNVFLTHSIVFSSKIMIAVIGFQVILFLFLWVHTRILDMLILPELHHILRMMSHGLQQVNLIIWGFYWLAMMGWTYISLYNTRIVKRKIPHQPQDAIGGFLIPILCWIKPYRMMAYLEQIWMQNVRPSSLLRWAWGLWLHFSFILMGRWLFGFFLNKNKVMSWMLYDLLQLNMLLALMSSALSAFLFAKIIQKIHHAQYHYFQSNQINH